MIQEDFTQAVERAQSEMNERLWRKQLEDNLRNQIQDNILSESIKET